MQDCIREGGGPQTEQMLEAALHQAAPYFDAQATLEKDSWDFDPEDEHYPLERVGRFPPPFPKGCSPSAVYFIAAVPETPADYGDTLIDDDSLRERAFREDWSSAEYRSIVHGAARLCHFTRFCAGTTPDTGGHFIPILLESFSNRASNGPWTNNRELRELADYARVQSASTLRRLLASRSVSSPVCLLMSSPGDDPFDNLTGWVEPTSALSPSSTVAYTFRSVCLLF